MIGFEKILLLYRKVFCECPECGTVFRLSDAQIQSAARPSTDWLSKINADIRGLEAKIQRAEEQFKRKREEVVARQRKKSEREVATKVARIVPNFKQVAGNTRDIKVIGHPVKFVSFDGKDEGEVKRIRFIDYPPGSKTQERMLRSIEKTLRKGNVEWKTLRIDESGRVGEEEEEK